MKATAYDEMYAADGAVRPHYAEFADWLAGQPKETLARKREEADLVFHRLGITFAVYGEAEGTERLIPFDQIPRILPAAEWAQLAAGLRQRVRALNAFLGDIYHGQEILKAGRIPAAQVLQNVQYRPEMQGLDVPGGIYAHIAGVDLVRAGAGEFYVLEDNLRVPSGVSYMLEDRRMMMRLFPDLFARHSIAPVEHYPDTLLEVLRTVAPVGVSNPTVALLTPGAYNSAYFDDVIYRRLDDDFLDPLAFRQDSMLGVPGLLSVYRAGRITLANAIGTGVADDKSIYPYVPEMVRFYLGEEPLLNNVPTYMLRKPDDLAYVLDHLAELVVKEVHGSGGYGMLVGPAATKQEIEDFRTRIVAAPEKYIAQPTLALSTCPIFVDSGIAPRHIDLRPFVLSGREIRIVPGGLTRVALREGSLVVNSSQGGGTKDTWVLED